VNALAIVGCCLGCAALGGLLGLTRSRGADDLGIGAGMDMVGGAIVGGFVGMCAGAVVFT
jgi:hypothetical protein